MKICYRLTNNPFGDTHTFLCLVYFWFFIYHAARQNIWLSGRMHRALNLLRNCSSGYSIIVRVLNEVGVGVARKEASLKPKCLTEWRFHVSCDSGHKIAQLFLHVQKPYPVPMRLWSTPRYIPSPKPRNGFHSTEEETPPISQVDSPKSPSWTPPIFPNIRDINYVAHDHVICMYIYFLLLLATMSFNN